MKDSTIDKTGIAIMITLVIAMFIFIVPVSNSSEEKYIKEYCEYYSCQGEGFGRWCECYTWKEDREPIAGAPLTLMTLANKIDDFLHKEGELK